MTGSPPTPGEPDHLAAFYDPETLAALDAWSPPRSQVPEPRGPVGTRPGWRGLTAGVALNAMVLGVADALDEGPAHEAVVELRPAPDPERHRAVTFVMVPDAPRASRVTVRPWLLAG